MGMSPFHFLRFFNIITPKDFTPTAFT